MLVAADFKCLSRYFAVLSLMASLSQIAVGRAAAAASGYISAEPLFAIASTNTLTESKPPFKLQAGRLRSGQHPARLHMQKTIRMQHLAEHTVRTAQSSLPVFSGSGLPCRKARGDGTHMACTDTDTMSARRRPWYAEQEVYSRRRAHHGQPLCAYRPACLVTHCHQDT